MPAPSADGCGTDRCEPVSVLDHDITRVPRSAEEARRWYDRISAAYDVIVDPFESEARSAGIELLSPATGQTVLDVGCGTGTALRELGTAVGPSGRAYGLDISPRMCHRAVAKVRAASLRQTGVLRGDARALPFETATVDAMFASFVLELFDTPELEPVLREWRRVLTPDGTLGIVSLSKRPNRWPVRVYERVHRLAPQFADCRPIFVVETLEAGGFRPRRRLKRSVAGLPVDVVTARPADGQHT